MSLPPPATSLLRHALAWRFAPPPVADPRPPRDLPLEGLRGGAALMVLYAHLVHPGQVVDPAYAPSPYLSLLSLPHASVLVFFVLSGYVIGLVTHAAPTPASVRSYGVRRARRILPIYLFSIALGVLAGPGDEWLSAACHLLFLQNSVGYGALATPLLAANPNLWSLHYEAVFYLAFVPLWLLRPRASLLLPGTFALAIAAALAPGGFHFVAHLAFGFLFWLGGLALAWTRPSTPAPRSTWPAALLAVLATSLLNPLGEPFAKLGLAASALPVVQASDLAQLPPILWLLTATTGHAPRLERHLARFSCATLSLLCVWRLACGIPLADAFVWLGFIAVPAATLFAFFPVPRAPLARLAPVGLVSYGLYAVGYPVQKLVLASPLPEGHALAWIIRVTVSVALAFALAILLERILPRWRANRDRLVLGFRHRLRRTSP